MTKKVYRETRDLMMAIRDLLHSQPDTEFHVQEIISKTGANESRVHNALRRLKENPRSRIRKTRFGYYAYISSRPRNEAHQEDKPAPVSGRMYEEIGTLQNGETILRSETGTLHVVAMHLPVIKEGACLTMWRAPSF